MAETLTTAPPLPATFAGFKAPEKQAIQKIRYSHDAMIDMIVANPWVSQGELARNFGYTEGWVSQVIASDAFQARLAERKNELVDPRIRATIEERMKGLVTRSIEILMKKLEAPVVSDELAIKALEVASRAAGYGAKSAAVQVNNSFVVAVPAKAESAAAWINQHGAGGQPVVCPSAGPVAEDAVIVSQLPAPAALVAPGSAAPNLPAGPGSERQSVSLLDELKGS